MRPRLATVGLPAVLLAVAGAALSVGRGAPPRATPAPLPSAAPGVAVSPPRGPLDTASLRDVFRFADEPPRSSAVARPARVLPSPAATPAPVGPRLVGVLRRGGRLVAVLALDGQVELAGAGESAAGVTVTAVSEDGASVRRRDGSQARLLLPD